MKRKREVKIVVNYPEDKEQLTKIDKIKIDGLLDIIFRGKAIDTVDKK